MKKTTALVLIVTAMTVGFHAYAQLAPVGQPAIINLGTTTLQEGSTGQYVVGLQVVLNHLLDTSLVTDGAFGLKTKLAVETFQSEKGLFPDGVVGPITRQALIMAQGGSVSQVVPTQPIIVTGGQTTYNNGQTASQCSPRLITSITSGIQQSSIGIPLIEITSPLAGGTYQMGSTMDVTWINCNAAYNPTLSISLAGTPPSYSTMPATNVMIASGIPANIQRYQFTIPQNLNDDYTYSLSITDGAQSDSNYDTATSGQFYILAEGVASPEPTSQSGISFVPGSVYTPVSGTTTQQAQTTCLPRTITTLLSGTSQTTTGIPLFEITSPTAGSTYQSSTINAAWINCSASNTQDLSIYLETTPPSYISTQTSETLVGQGIPVGNQQYSFTIPPSVLANGDTYSLFMTDGAESDSNYDTGTSGSFTVY